ncbi:methyltransferase domain-containing protein [Candidatus Woesearchaeota archaeon]|nr:methyltransferase domain-containing protein [Candidatus Woesearchaeota archaeon]
MTKDSEKLLIDAEGYKYIFKGNDLHTKDGLLTKEAIAAAKPGDVIATNKNVSFHVLEPSFLDKYWKIKRNAQIIPLKDLGFIAAEVGLCSDWIIAEAGSGSGGACCFFAHLCSAGKMYTFDIREDYLKIVSENVAFLDLKNVELKKHNIYEGIPLAPESVNMVLLDLPEPWLGVDPAFAALKHGGYLVSYSPSVPQVMDFVNKIRETPGFLYLKTCEIAEKEWDVLGRKVRPRSQSIGHSGFLTFVRKL